MHILEAPIRWWKCPSCGKTDRTQRPDQQGLAQVQFHECPALKNVCVPLVEVQGPDDRANGRHVVVQSQVSHGAASVRTERGDGSNDTTIFAQPARGTIS